MSTLPQRPADKRPPRSNSDVQQSLGEARREYPGASPAVERLVSPVVLELISAEPRKPPDNLRDLNGTDRNLVYRVIGLVMEQRLTVFPSQGGEVKVMDMAFLHPFYSESHQSAAS